jgi:hypothetical protein
MIEMKHGKGIFLDTDGMLRKKRNRSGMHRTPTQKTKPLNKPSSKKRFLTAIFMLSLSVLSMSILSLTAITAITAIDVLSLPLYSADGSTMSSYTLKQGLEIKIISDPKMRFIHVQLAIYYKDKMGNPALPYLAMLHLLDRDVNKNPNSLQNLLRKLGNDYEVENRPDFLYLRINFLEDKLSVFRKFFKGLYSYKPLLSDTPDLDTYSERKKMRSEEDKFKDNVANYWKYFFKRELWKKEIAYQIAYSHFFPLHILGQTLITPRNLKNITVDTLREFYKKNYKLSNSYLVIKGNFNNSGIIYGSLAMTFNSFKKEKSAIADEKELVINPNQRIYLFDVNDNEPPIIFWYEANYTHHKSSPLMPLIRNNTLFAFPFGRLYTSARKMDIRGLQFETETVNHQHVSVICNTIRLRYTDIERFILIAEREKRSLKTRPVDRPEYLKTFTRLLGRTRINTADFENEATLEILKTRYQFNTATQAALKQVINAQDRSTLVILGNVDKILANLDRLKANVEIVDFGK